MRAFSLKTAVIPATALVVASATLGVTLVALVSLTAAPGHAESVPAAEIRPRVDHHIRQVKALTAHFDGFVTERCPRFATVGEWEAYAEGEIERMLLLVAHAEQAWAEAKRTADDDVRRVAKAPRRRRDEALLILQKLAVCAEDNGATLSPGAVYRRIERDLPARQADVALPR